MKQIVQVVFFQLSKFTKTDNKVKMRNETPSDKFAFLFSPKHSPIKTSQRQHPLATLITSISKQQGHTFSTLSQKCSAIQYAIAAVEVLTTQLAEKVQKINESRESQMLGSLKIKQSEFIIGELKGTLLKQSKKEEKILEQLEAEKKKTEKYREENYKLETKNVALSQKISNLQTVIRNKTELLQNSHAAIQKIRSEHEGDMRNRNKSFASKQSLSLMRSNEEYGQLEAKIEELERQFNSEIQKLVGKNNELSLQLKKAQDNNIDISNTNKALKRDIEQLTKVKYEIEIKAKQNTIQMNELEEGYSKLVEKSNNNEIMLHKQLQEYKVKEIEIKNQFKKQKKQFKVYLSALAQHINNSKYYFTANLLKDQIEELKKLYEKGLKKKMESLARELEYYQAQHKKTKQRADELQLKIVQIEKAKSSVTSSKDLESEVVQKIDRVSQNGSLLNNRSHDRSEQEKKNVEEKYKNKLETLRKDIKTKQSKINDLEKMQQVEFDRNKQKILELELTISEKINDIRKLQLKFKERQYEFGEYQSKIKELQARIKFLTQKLQGEKETNTKMIEMKTQSYEQKLKIVKNNYKQLQKKQQQKTIKYNKLKSRYEKYELEASESLKRKNAQIDQLLKENNKFKTENKLLEEKININNIIENQISKNKTPTTAVNQDLIEQIEMERDRISSELADKQKKYLQISDTNQKLNAENIGIRKQIKQLRNKIDEMLREERFLKEENKFAKQKIEELTKNNQEQDEAKHTYFKKQLEKSVINVKKLQKACQKYALQREQRKKQLEEKIKEIQTLKITAEKAKQKKSKLEAQLQDEKQSKKRLIIDYDRKLSQCATKEEQLVEIINYKNREGSEIRQSMKGEELIIEQVARLKFNIDTMTDQIVVADKAINTDPFEHESQPSLNQPEKQIIPSELIFGNDFELETPQKSRRQVQHVKVDENPKMVNYFGDLIMTENEGEDHFQICDEGEEVLERASQNIQLKQTFNVVRQSIQKLFNEQDISVSTVKLLPKQLEEDFNEFISYIKQKIVEIKSENNLTFIMAEAGNEPEDIQTQLHEFISKPSTEYIKLRKIIEQKEYMITSLMNEKTEQENTINEQQNVQEQAERLHLQQYSVLKNEIHEQKQALDKQQLYYQSLKNIIKKMMNFWIEDEDNYEDFEDNLQLITTIYKFNAKQLQLLKLYLRKYKELKQIQ